MHAVTEDFKHLTAPKTSDYFGVYTVGSIEVESEEVVQTFALSA
eukprot:COSAG01_NODE_42963_length_434_cov_2.331343_1_plen_43_part_01